DRSDLVLPVEHARRGPVRREGNQEQVSGPARSDREPLLRGVRRPRALTGVGVVLVPVGRGGRGPGRCVGGVVLALREAVRRLGLEGAVPGVLVGVLVWLRWGPVPIS